MLGDTQPVAGGTRLALSGDLDLVVIDELRATLHRAVDGSSGNVLLDISDVEYVDLVALSAILAVADALRDSGRMLHVAGAHAQVRRMCALLNADDVLAPTLPMPRRPVSC